MRVLREVTSAPARRLGSGSGSSGAAEVVAVADTELAGDAARLRAVACGFGALLRLLLVGLHARTVHERVPSTKVLRLTSNPIPRLLVLDRPSSSMPPRWKRMPRPLPSVGTRRQHKTEPHSD